MHKTIVGAAIAMLVTMTSASSAADGTLNFKSCPIVRDTATVPCWLAESEGKLYYLGIQTDLGGEFSPPLQGHQALVEGTVTSERICGGIVLKPVRVSTLPELDSNCNTLLPAEDQYQIDFNPRPPGPTMGREPLSAGRQRVRAPVEVEDRREFEVQFEFDGKVRARNAGTLNRIYNYARAADASRVTVVGRQGGALLSNGQRMEEKRGIAQARAEEVASLLQKAGMTAKEWKVSWNPAAKPDGSEDWLDRQVTVTVER